MMISFILGLLIGCIFGFTLTCIIVGGSDE